jgi:tripartite-type tricarboxylate transporter receptor subunit TctC
LAKVPNVFVIHPDVPAKTFQEFIAYAKKNPGKLDYGSAGNASAGHLAMEYLKLVSGISLTHIPYRGTGPQLADLLAGRTHASSAGLPALGAHIRAGKLRAIAVGTPQRISEIKASLLNMGTDELQTMSDNLSDLISVLMTRQVAVEDTILDRLEARFAK